MSAPPKALMAWSGGKESAYALFEVISKQTHVIASLLTTVTETYGRISMHGVREALLERQADVLGLPLEKVTVPAGTTNDVYESRMRAALERHRARGISSVIFGDIFLEDLRRYREARLGEVGMTGVFPLWGRDTTSLARAFFDAGFKAVVTCVDSRAVDRRLAGREFDARFLSELPRGADPCGENGEFHTFVYDGPVFRRPVAFERGAVVEREGRFWYCDLMPVRRGKTPCE